MGRETERRSIYCDVVNVIDLSEKSKPEDVSHRPRGDIFRQGGEDDIPLKVDLEDLLVDIAYYRRKCPRLERILYWDPIERDDDAYIVRINPNSTTPDMEIQLESKVIIDVRDTVFKIPDLPPTPEVPAGCRIKHTIAILLIGEADFRDFAGEGEYVEFKKSLKDWLYANKGMDRRVTRIEHQTSDNVLEITTEDIIKYLGMRQEGDCEAVTGLSLPEGTDLRRISPYLHPQIRKLRIHSSLLHDFGNSYQSAIDLLDLALPNLQQLLVDGPFFSDKDAPNSMGTSDGKYRPLSGLPNLRFLDFQANVGSLKVEQEVGFAVYLSGLAAKECVFANRRAGGSMVWFNEVIMGLKKRDQAKDHKNEKGQMVMDGMWWRPRPVSTFFRFINE